MQKMKNRAVERTKGWIFEALLALMDEKPYQSIGISDITDKAGVARSSFYRNFESKDDIIIQYMDDILRAVILKITENSQKGEADILTIIFRTFLEYETFLKKLSRNNIEHLFTSFADKFEEQFLDMYKDMLTSEENLVFQYSVRFQIGGMIRMTMPWMKNGMALPPEKIAALLSEFISPFKARKCSITDLLVRIKIGEKA